MPKRSLASLQDLAVDSIVTQVLEQDQGHVFRLLARVRRTGPTLRDDDVLELIEGEVAYRVLARHVPTHARALLEDLLERRPMYGAKIPLGDPAAASGTDEMDDDRWYSWRQQLGQAVAALFGVEIPTTWEFGEDPSEVQIPGLGLCVRQLVHYLDQLSHVLQLWRRSLIEPDHNYDCFGADVLFHKDDLEALDFTREWPPEGPVWLWRTIGAVGDAAGWDVVRDEDAEHSPAARLLLRKGRYAFAIVKAIDTAYDELEGMLLSCKEVECSTKNWVEQRALHAPPRATVLLHWGREKEY